MAVSSEPIAIIGMACRFSGNSNNPQKFWELLHEPRVVATKIPADRFNLRRFYHPNGAKNGTTNVEESYFLSENIQSFDAQFFNIPPTEAEAIDPQQRMLLEVVYEALEYSGIPIERLHGSNTAVYVGIMCNDYAILANRDLNFLPKYCATGTAISNASSRISYLFDWHGPSMTIDTACSSSLVAVHQAVQQLRTGLSDIAVAAGTNLIIDAAPYVSESNLSMLSPSGRSRMWDADADGYARGEGVAAIILKTLSRALADGDTIDCIIRETGVGQDGRTAGITMPNGTAQAALIRDTYARAGLDPRSPKDRCQYFEAHGTGTPAGDPQEAEALYNAFFENTGSDSHNENEDRLWVGSVKSVIGHTEGAAGLAGLLKACMALKHKTIPPNLLFRKLNPRIQPFYEHLQIPTQPRPWPNTPNGAPRRASVNSFGFGGTNAHAILESHEPRSDPAIISKRNSGLKHLILPFVFSASTQKTLLALLSTSLTYFKSHPFLNTHDLAYTLGARRSTLSVRAAFSALNLAELCEKLEARLDEGKPFGGQLRGITSSPSILGVFTGQGAQWPQMGVQLITTIPIAREIIQALDESLHTLPEKSDRPEWSIMTELQAESSCSSIGDAQYSQPLCTAVQIVLVDLFRIAGVHFKAVIGHSSGEIAAAYAAGLLSASDAIRIAYYRGLYAKLAGGTNKKKGAMMAVGTSLKDAQDFCSLEEFKESICVAASNAPTSVTLSGDDDAITHAKMIFGEEEKKFVRLLKVDTAYHSHHMLPCCEPYNKSLLNCKIQINDPPEDAPTWYSTVNAGKTMTPESHLRADYWVQNMRNTVLFSEGLKVAAMECGAFDMAIEIGPHPALRGPVTETIQEMDHNDNKSLEYVGVMIRGKHDIVSLTNAFASLWTNFGNSGLQFSRLFDFYPKEERLRFSCLQDLPSYPWDRDQKYWAESRSAKLFRTGEIPSPRSSLLGIRTADSTFDKQWSWQNVLKISELPWLTGHSLQGQVIFPATGYIELAMEAAVQLAENRSTSFIELRDLQILRVVALDDLSGTEVLVTMSSIKREQDGNTILADYTFYSAVSGGEYTKMVMNASGKVKICLGDHNSIELGGDYLRLPPLKELVDVDIGEFYATLADLGYDYDGPFKAMSTLKRRLGQANGSIHNTTSSSLDDSHLVFHPAMLDTSIQSMLIAAGAPGDGTISTLHVPTTIDRVTLIPSLCGDKIPDEVSFECHINTPGCKANRIVGDVYLFGLDGRAVIGMEGLQFAPLTEATESDDRLPFSHDVWAIDRPDGDLALNDIKASLSENEKAIDLERIAFYYLRLLIDMKEKKDITIQSHHDELLQFCARLQENVLAGKHAYVRGEWVNDTPELIDAICNRYGDCVDIQILKTVGEGLPGVIRGEADLLEILTKGGLIDTYYREGLGYPVANRSIARMAKQVSHRYPHMAILEIGAGTGGATEAVLDEINTAYASYTFTDISSGFFTKAQSKFKAKRYSTRMKYKVLDIEKSPTVQGFNQHSYDMIIASNVLHATKNLERTLRNVRQLLKPGGYLLLLEIEDQGPLRVALVVGGLPGWWIGKDDGRINSPTISSLRWNTELKRVGFSGIDTITPFHNPLPFHVRAFVSQALDENVKLLRQPLFSRPDQIGIDSVILLGGAASLETSKMMEEVHYLLSARGTKVSMVPSLEDLQRFEEEFQEKKIPSTVISFLDLDAPVFKDLTELRWKSLQRLFVSTRNLLWITREYRSDNPWAAMTVGLIRSVLYELPHLQVQLVDIDTVENLSYARIIVECLLRLQLASNPEGHEKSILWTTEPEVSIRDGKTNILRVLPHKAQNDRYNSARRLITKDVKLSASVVRLHWKMDNCVLHEERRFKEDPQSSCLTINVETSTLSALRIRPGVFLFLGIGYESLKRQNFLFLSTKNSSTLQLPPYQCLSLSSGSEASTNHPIYLSLALGHIIAEQIKQIAPGGSILIHGIQEQLALLLQMMASERDRIFFSTSDPNVKSDLFIFLPRNWRRSDVEAVLPQNIALFLDLSVGSADSWISDIVPQFCGKGDKSLLFSNNAFAFSDVDERTTALLLSETNSAVLNVLSSSAVSQGMAQMPVVSLRDLVRDVTEMKPYFTTINWLADPTVPVSVLPADADDNLFRGDRTYWLIGLTGDLGQSICDWMADHGATHIVLTSRSPKVPRDWIARLKKRGVTVASISGDITQKDNLERVRQEIENQYPEIGGVANGALVLRDEAFENMSLETFQLITKPKVDGIRHLDEIFSSKDLEFFIAFSSVVSSAGNNGQSAYSAANMFMKSIIAQRRNRGLAGAVIDISRVVGVGYVERESRNLTLSIKQFERLKHAALPMSERDLHQLFAEGVLCGKSNSPEDSHDIISGYLHINERDVPKVYWAENVKLSHFVSRKNDVTDGIDNAVPAKASIKTQLASVQNTDAALRIIINAFQEKVRSSLWVPEDQVVEYSIPLLELGVDSLVAVEIRAWFLRELRVDVPVVRILGASSIADLVKDIVHKLPEELLPRKFADTSASTDTKDISEGNGVTPTPTLTSQPGQSASPSSPISSESSRSTPSQYPPNKNDTIDPPKSERELKDDSCESENRFSIEISINTKPEILRTEPLSYPQSRFWFIHHYLEDKTTTNVTFWLQINGHIDYVRLKRAVDIVCQEHESLRTCFFTDGNRPCQGIMETSNIRLQYETVTRFEQCLDIFQQTRNHVYRIEVGETMKLTLCQISNTNSYCFIVGYHHICLDGSGWDILGSEIQEAYQTGSLTPVPRQYSEWAYKQRLAVESSDADSDREFWKKELNSLELQTKVLPPPPTLQVSQRKTMHRYEQHFVNITLDTKLSKLIKERCRSQKVSPFHFHLATFKTLLFRLLSVNDLCVGFSDSNRTEAGDDRVVGCTLNLLPLRFFYNKDQTVNSALLEARSKTLVALGHSKVPFNVILDDIGVPRSTTNTPIFQTFIDYRQHGRKTFAGRDVYQPPESYSSGHTGYDILLNVLEVQNGDCTVSIGCQASLYSEQDTAVVSRCYSVLLEAFAKSPSSSRAASVRMFDDLDTKDSLVIGRGPYFPQKWPATLPHRIDQMIIKYGESPALNESSGKALTYREMDYRIDCLANVLRSSGVVIGSVVALLQEPSTDWICSMLAIMRLGAVYVPLDLKLGIQRLAQIAQACEPSVIMVDAGTKAEVTALGVPIPATIDVSTIRDSRGPLENGRVSTDSHPDGIAAILFTSGTTGKPKGILLKHSNLRNQIEGEVEKHQLGREIVLQQTMFTFDLSMNEIFAALCNGGRVHIVDQSRRGDPQAIMRILVKEGITYTRATPHEYLSWINHGASALADVGLRSLTNWKFAFSSGDRLTFTVLEAFRSLGLTQLELLNAYGPAETIVATDGTIDYRANNFADRNAIPLGKPFPNYSIYILDENLEPLPLGYPGEIVIGGAGVSAGYLNDDGLTKEKFLNDPFAPQQWREHGWTQMYRSGDRGRLLADGTVLFHGRIETDNQVKLAGVRVELEDIEKNILSAAKGTLSDVVCTLRNTETDQFLIAHAVFSIDTDMSTEQQIAYLRQLNSQLPLPRFMKPALIIPSTSLPLTTHQKLDRDAVAGLPIPTFEGELNGLAVSEYPETAEKPVRLTPTEAKVKSLWQRVLPKEIPELYCIPTADFFNIGGNSALLIKVQGLIRSKFGIGISLPDLVAASTLGSMATVIDKTMLVGDINYDDEAALPNCDSYVNTAGSSPLKSENMEIILTGATGHLGRSILSHLVASKAVAKIHCIGVRKSSSIQTTSEKIVVYQGDLRDSILGLSKFQFNSLASTADAIIHTAAQRSHWDPYRFLRETNVEPLKVLIQLSSGRRIPIHFLSSGGIASKIEDPLSSSSFQPTKGDLEGYLATKWVGERLLEGACSSLDIPVYIYRTTFADPSLPNQNAGPLRSGLPIQLFEDMVRLSIVTKLLPNPSGWTGRGDFVSVTDVANGVCSTATGSLSDHDRSFISARYIGHKDKATYIHFPGIKGLTTNSQLQAVWDDRAIREVGIDQFTVVDGAKWIGKLKENGFQWMVAAQDATLEEGILKTRR